MYIVNGDGNVLCDEMYCHALRARREANKIMSLMVENGGGMITTTGLNRDHYDGHEWWEYKRHSVWAGIEEPLFDAQWVTINVRSGCTCGKVPN